MNFCFFFKKRREEIYGQFYNIRIILNWIGVEGAPSGSTLDIVVTEKRGKKNESSSFKELKQGKYNLINILVHVTQQPPSNL